MVFWFFESIGINEMLISYGKVGWILLYISVCVWGCIIFFPLLENKLIVNMGNIKCLKSKS